MYVKDWMTTDPVAVAPDASLYDAKGIMKRCKIRHIPVVDGGRVVGLLSQTDVLHASALLGERIDTANYFRHLQSERIDAHMTPNVVTVEPGTPIEDVAALMRDRKIGCVVVTEGGTLRGILTQTDLFDILASSLGPRAGSARAVFELPADAEQDVLNRIGEWLHQGRRRLRYLATYQPRDGGVAQIMVRAQEIGDT